MAGVVLLLRVALIVRLILLLRVAKLPPPLAKPQLLLALLLMLPLPLPSNSGSRNEKPAFWPVFLRP